MGLKSFHIFFIVVSTLLCLGFGMWAVGGFGDVGGGMTPLGVASFAVAVVLVVYGFWFLRKLRNVSFQ